MTTECFFAVINLLLSATIAAATTMALSISDSRLRVS